MSTDISKSYTNIGPGQVIAILPPTLPIPSNSTGAVNSPPPNVQTGAVAFPWPTEL